MAFVPDIGPIGCNTCIAGFGSDSEAWRAQLREVERDATSFYIYKIVNVKVDSSSIDRTSSKDLFSRYLPLFSGVSKITVS